jgi:hypothetical protein
LAFRGEGRTGESRVAGAGRRNREVAQVPDARVAAPGRSIGEKPDPPSQAIRRPARRQAAIASPKTAEAKKQFQQISQDQDNRLQLGICDGFRLEIIN